MRRKTLIRDYARRAATALLLAMLTAATAGARHADRQAAAMQDAGTERGPNYTPTPGGPGQF